jgi:hypothetical protein
MKLVALVGLIVLLGFSDERDSSTEFPTPPHTKKSLFFIHRSPNPNTVIYDLNVSDKNIIDPENPVKVYWIRYGEKGQQRDLNYVERTFAYGVKSESIDSKKFRISFVAKKDKIFEATIDEKGQALAKMTIAGKPAKLARVYVQVSEDGWWPKVAYVEFFGTDLETNRPAYEKMIID